MKDKISHEEMLAALEAATGVDFSANEAAFDVFVAGATSAFDSSELFDGLAAIDSRLRESRVAGTIRAIEAWTSGTNEFRVVPKSWRSVVDKLYRINVEDNDDPGNPPKCATIRDLADDTKTKSLEEWVTPLNAHLVIDDLVRTKFVLPFIDDVVSVGEEIWKLLDRAAAGRFRRFHAKDSGYHAQHFYGLLSVPSLGAEDREIAVEVKVLTKLQDMLGELTHLMYESQRTGSMEVPKKRKSAWRIDETQFDATYIGHAAHNLEAQISKLKRELVETTESTENTEAESDG